MGVNAEHAVAAAVDLAWSLWRELGVPGPIRRHDDWTVVPEPLILFTAALRDHDRRLRNQAVAWCAQHMALVSTSALRHTYTRERWPVAAIADVAATMAQRSGARWPGCDVGRPFQVAEVLEPWGSPLAERSTFPLRVRAALGVGARAESVRALLLLYPCEPTIAELSDATFATKRQTAYAVEHLEWAGIADVDRRNQPYRVRLRRPAQLVGLFAPMPAVTTEWGPLLRVMTGVVEALNDVATMPVGMAGAELHRRLRNLDDQLARLRLEQPRRAPEDGYLDATTEWLVSLITDVASGIRTLPFVWRVQVQEEVNG